MSFSSLPNELLLQIVESIAPRTIHRTTYDKRQATLRAVSLVSRPLRRIAQPLLREIAWIRSPSMLGAITKAADSSGWGHLVTEVAFENLQHSFSPELVLLAATFPKASNLRVISCFGTVDLSLMIAFSNLSSLHLSCGFFAATGVRLPNLKQLTLVGKQLETALRTNLDPIVLPSLEALAFAKIPQKTLLTLSRNPSTIKLFRQVDILVLPMEAVTADVVSNIRTILPKILIDADTDCSDAYGRAIQYAYHIRARNFNFGWPGRERVPDGSPLRSMYLNIELQPSRNRRYNLNRFLRSCDSKGVRVIYEERPQDVLVDSLISPDFLSRQRERRRQRGSSKVDVK